MLVDSHCHLDFEDFTDELDDVIARARDAGIGTIQTISTRLSRFAGVLAIAERYDDVWCSAGVHPHEAANESDITAGHLTRFARHERVIGIGETGLDYYYEHSPRQLQRDLFRVHIAAARETGLPLIVHSRNADDEMAEILADEMAKGPFTGLMHCFSSSAQLAEIAVDLGLYISISGIVTFKSAGALRDIVKGLPRDRLLVETDAPYLAPVPKRGKRNEPAYTAHTARAVATLLDIPEDEFAALTTDNFFTLFTKATRPQGTESAGEGGR